MRGRIEIRGCSGGKKKKKKEVCGLLSLPHDVFLECLAQLSRLDVVAIATVSSRHRKLAVSHKLWSMRYRRQSVETYMYVFMHMYPDPSPRWFVFHPVQRRLKRIHPTPAAPAPLEGSCFVKTDWGIFTIGGLVDGKPTSQVTFLDCIDHTVDRVAPMKMARSGASASLIEDGENMKIYVFGGCCWDDSNSNWVEVYDIHKETWEFLSVSTPNKMPLRIKESMVMEEQHVYAVAEDGEILFFSASESRFWASNAAKESDPENKNDWGLYDETIICRGVGGTILWRSVDKLGWNQVKGLEELLQQQHIIKICRFPPDRIAIFWSQGPAYQTLELWFAEVSLRRHWEGEGEEYEVRGKIEWSGPVFSDSSVTAFHLLYADSLFL